VIARDARHRQHVVERHRDVGDDDLNDGVAERLGRVSLGARIVRLR
jgi:hypothetical protein